MAAWAITATQTETPRAVLEAGHRTATIGVDSPTITPESPVVLNLKVLYSYPGMPSAEQGHSGRAEMLTTSFRDYERQIRQQFTDMFARSGFDARRDIAGIILNR